MGQHVNMVFQHQDWGGRVLLLLLVLHSFFAVNAQTKSGSKPGSLAAELYHIGPVEICPSLNRDTIQELFQTEPDRAWPRHYEARGWHTWDTRSVLRHVLMPEQLAITLGLHKVAKNGEQYLTDALIGRKDKGAETVVAQHNQNGITTCEVYWKGARIRISTVAKADKSWTAKIEALEQPDSLVGLPVRLTILMHNVWRGDHDIKLHDRGFVTTLEGEDYVLSASKPLDLEHNYPGGANALGCSLPVGKVVSLRFVPARTLVANKPARKRTELVQALNISFDTSGELATKPVTIRETATEVAANMLGWNTIYDPVKHRVLTTVNRIWNVERGGYVVFCWDNFFNTVLLARHDTLQAWYNFVQTLEERTPDGFVPNNSQGNGRASWDRSQPPVGTMVLSMITDDKPASRRIKSLVYEALVGWNNWWWQNRKNGPLLSWGSKQGSVPNKFLDAAWNNHLAAALESGADDSPIFDAAKFDSTSGLMMQHEVGLNSLYAYDCLLLAQIAEELGHPKDATLLRKRAASISGALMGLWNAKRGIFMNRLLPKYQLDTVLTPFNFLPLLLPNLTESHVEPMLKWLHDPKYFGEPFGLPSVMRTHPDYGKQRYWRGATWPPMNFLVYVALDAQLGYLEAKGKRARQSATYKAVRESRQWLATMSGKLFMDEYLSKNYVGENYSSISGTCDDGLVKAETNYLWGLLLPEISLREGTR